MTKGILIAGFGGQGALFVGKILAYCGLIEGKELSWLPSYGPEMRGGTANCSVWISDEPVGSPQVLEPDYLIAMNYPSYAKFINKVSPDGIESPISDYFEEWEDCQKEFSKKMDSPKIYNLSEALIITDIQFDENIHDGLVDAENTALLFIKMKKETSLKMSPYYSSESYSESPTYRPFANLLMNFKCV